MCWGWVLCKTIFANSEGWMLLDPQRKEHYHQLGVGAFVCFPFFSLCFFGVASGYRQEKSENC